MKFKVGEKVKIKKNLKKGYDFKYYVADEMEKFKGKTVTIYSVNSEAYRIEEDNMNWEWTEDMLEGLAIITKEELFKMPLGTIIKTDEKEHNIFVKVGENDFYNDDADHIESCDVNDDLSLKYFGNKIIEIQEPNYTTIYKEDKQVKEMTIAEIEKELGYPIKVVKEEE